MSPGVHGSIDSDTGARLVVMRETRSGITFGPYRLEPGADRLWKGPQPIALQPRPLAVLSYLAARPGTVIARDELIEALWPTPT